jgi:hypothetical protein
MVSPSIVRAPDGRWRMYEVDAGRDGCSARSTQVVLRHSADGVAWGTASAAAFVQPGYQPWHLDVQYVAARGEYWALVAAYVSGRGCTTTSLFLATSPDGLAWTTYRTPVLAPHEFSQFSSAVYRSTFVYAPGGDITIWYSGARVVTAASKKKPAMFAWSAAMSRTTADALLTRVSSSAAAPMPVTTVGGIHLAPADRVP